MALVRRMYAAFHGGDAQRAVAHFAADVAVDATSRPDSATGTGREALGRIVASWVTTFDEWSEKIEEVRDLGDHVLAIAVQRGRGKGSGVEIETRYAVLFRVEDGEISAMTLYPDEAAALEAAGEC